VKVVFVNRYFHPDISATSQLLTELAADLAAAGREVHVVTSRQRYDDASARLALREAILGVVVHRVWTSRFGRGSLAGRALDYLTFYFSAGATLLRVLARGDVVVAKTDPPLISVVAAWVARRRRAVLVNWIQDVFPEVAERLGVIPSRGLIGTLARALRDYSVRAAAVNVVLGERMAEELARATRGCAANVQVIHNWSDGTLVHPVQRESNVLRAEWGLADLFIVGYSGNMGRAHEFETILGAAELLRGVPDIAFLFIGGGKQAAWVRDEAGRRGLGASFYFRDYQPRERLVENLSVPDAHLVSLRPELEGLIVPSKFYGIAAAGRPTLFVGDPDGEIARIVSRYDCGKNFSVEDAEGLAGYIRALAQNPDEVARLGSNARTMLETNYSQAKAFDSWHKVLSACVSEGLEK
jgi:glycosyltransferase involved in cell wall biosynthesis